ncbi:hypothetical protein I3679_015335 [Proteus mirabilis]|uniref:Uncharacterized protein n=1 Tax=Proteus mirabilis TaxID=584 RepID=A0ABD5LWQ8_PROMI
MLPIILLSAYGINNPLLLVGDVIGQLVTIISLFLLVCVHYLFVVKCGKKRVIML